MKLQYESAEGFLLVHEFLEVKEAIGYVEHKVIIDNQIHSSRLLNIKGLLLQIEFLLTSEGTKLIK